MSLNTLISPSMVLALAMHDVIGTLLPDSAPFEVTAEFELPEGCLIMTHDEFNANVLRPAIDAAPVARRPWGGRVEFASPDVDSTQVFEGSEADGILGRLVQCYDYPADRALVRIDIRVPWPELVLERVRASMTPDKGGCDAV
jgi:hypothetical protein